MPRSLRWRIQFWHATILAIVIVTFVLLTWFHHSREQNRSINTELSAAVEVLTGQLKAAPPTAVQALSKLDPQIGEDGDDVRKLMADLVVPRTFGRRRYRHSSEAPYFVIWDDDGNVLKSSAEMDVAIPVASSQVRFRDTLNFREAFTAGSPGTVVLVGRFIGPDKVNTRNLLLLLLGVGSIVFLIGLIGGWLLSRRSVQPIQQISQTAATMSERNLSDRIDSTNMDSELQELAETLNSTFARLESAFAQQVQFTADASHELRTPLAVIRMHQELALSKERSPDEYRTALTTCQRATERMTSLVESLLALARLDAGELKLNDKQVALHDVIESAIRETQPLADAQQVTVVGELEPVHCEGDSLRLGQVVTNLLTNAIAHSSTNSQVIVKLNQTSTAATVQVIDTGRGIPAEDLDKVFDRFYRLDEDRTRVSGGSGLGLSICRTIIEAHRGQLSVVSTMGEGSTFEFTLPLAQQ